MWALWDRLAAAQKKIRYMLVLHPAADKFILNKRVDHWKSFSSVFYFNYNLLDQFLQKLYIGVVCLLQSVLCIKGAVLPVMWTFVVIFSLLFYRNLVIRGFPFENIRAGGGGVCGRECERNIFLCSAKKFCFCLITRALEKSLFS